jgi:DNA-binding MarR family transcriptional regulator
VPVAAPLLSEMLSALLVAYTIEFDNEFEHHLPHRTTAFGAGGPAIEAAAGEPVRGTWLTSMAMWSNFMRYVPPDGVALRQVEPLPANLAGLQRWGFVKITADEQVKATRAGRFAQAGWRRLDGVVDRRWEQRFGAGPVAALRDGLRVVATARGAGMPLYLPVVGYPDGMRSHYRDLRELGLPQPEVAELDLSALLSAVLLAFTLDYESEAKLPLPISANTLRVIADTGSRLADLPVAAGVSQEGVASSVGFLERHDLVRVGPDPAGRRGKFVRLTDRGRSARDRRTGRAVKIEGQWQETFGRDVVAQLRDAAFALLADRRDDGAPTLALGLKGYPDGWRSQRPYLAQTQARLLDPAAELPRHPMVLHRGGYPDGS